MNVYEDDVVALDERGITIKSYALAGNARQIPYESIRDARGIRLGFGTGRHRLVGYSPGRPRHFFHWDPHRFHKSVGISLDLGGWRRVAITPNQPTVVLHLLRSHITQKGTP